MRSIARALTALATFAMATPAAAQSAGVALSVPAGPGQQALALRVEAGGIRARVCAAAAGCTADGGTLVPVADDAKGRTGQAKATVVTLHGGKAVAHVEIPGETKGAGFHALIAAPLAGKGSEPLVLWSGSTGVPRGEHGEERSHAIVQETLPDGGTRVIVGEHRADVTMCGRPTLVGAKEIDGGTLEMVRAASVQNLSVADRAAATKLSAARATADSARASARLLRATAASSALGKKLAAITDGDPATAWSENKPGDGRGEFVSMAAADEVGIVALDVIVRPTEDVEGGAAPRRMYLATEQKLFEIAMPEDAWKQPAGTRYTVKLPAELKTECLAIVLDEAYTPAGKAGARVTIAEIEARTAFDGASPEALAGALAGGGARSKAAAAMLARSGDAGTRAAIAIYDKLDEDGKQLAAQVIDAAPCKDQAPFFASRFAAATAATRKKAAPGDVDPELAHARDRLRRCGRPAAEALAKVLAEGDARAKVAAAEELSALAPDAAVPVLLTAIGRADEAVRRDLRAALARAAKSPRALRPLGEALSKDKLEAQSEIVAIDLLRAAGPSLTSIAAAPEAFASLSARYTSMRARYLLQAPAAELARAGDRAALAYLRDGLRKDQDAPVRARAASAAGAVPDLASELAAAIDDAEPRVREAAIAAIAEARAHGGAMAASAAPALAKRLTTDDWTFVRAGAAQALGALPAEPTIDAALATALGDTSADVRGRAVDGLGVHRAAAHVDAIRGRQDDEGEVLDVRARAVLALGALCDAKSVGTWTTLAHIAKTPINERDRRLGGAAVTALGELGPKDLAQRLAPLLDKDAPAPLREMAKAAIAAKGRCSK